MKTLIMTMIVALSTQAFAAVELGKYSAKDKDSGSIQATFELRADKSVSFGVTSADLPKPVSCTGKWDVTADGKIFSAALDCDSDLLKKANVKINIANVTAENLRSATGVEVGVVIDALGEEPTAFMLKKVDSK